MLSATATATDLNLSDSEELIIEFEVVKRPADISFAKATASAYLDALADFSAPELLNPNNLEGITYVSSNEDVATVAADGKVTPLSVGVTTITATFAGNDEYEEAAPVSYTLTVEAEKPNIVYTNEYKQVKSVDELEAGANYVIAHYSNNGSMAMSTTSNVNNRLATNVTITDGILEATDETLIIILEGESGNWKLNAVNYIGEDKYLVFKESKSTHIEMANTSSEATAATIGFSTQGNVEIQSNGADETRTIRYYSGTPSFRYYNANNGAVCQLYRQIVKVVPKTPKLAEDSKFTVDGDVLKSDETTVTIKFAEGANDIYYKVTKAGGVDQPQTLAAEDHAHAGFTKYDSNAGITLTNTDTSLEYFACDAANGVDSDHVTLSLQIGPTGVGEIEAAEAGEVRWFDMQGREVKGQPESGIYVRVINGKASKVVVK